MTPSNNSVEREKGLRGWRGHTLKWIIADDIIETASLSWWCISFLDTKGQHDAFRRALSPSKDSVQVYDWMVHLHRHRHVMYFSFHCLFVPSFLVSLNHLKQASREANSNRNQSWRSLLHTNIFHPRKRHDITDIHLTRMNDNLKSRSSLKNNTNSRPDDDEQQRTCEQIGALLSHL